VRDETGSVAWMAETSFRAMPDGDLIRLAQAQTEAFAVFYDRHVYDVLRFLYARTDDSQTAADLTAETFAKALASLATYHDRGVEPKAWLFGIAKHELSHYWRWRRVDARARQRLGIERLQLDDTSIERIEDLVDFEEERASLRAAMSSLPRSIAQAVHLRVELELAYPEVARRLGCSEGAARVRVSRGLSRLSGLLSKEGGEGER